MSRTWDQLDAEYRAKGWSTIDPRKRDYCYQPCRFGIHVCGHHPDGQNCMTILNIPTRTFAEAEALFQTAMADLAEPAGQEADYVVDLQNNYDCERDFMMNRQMIDRLRALTVQGDAAMEAG